jgi:ATP-dependent protease ClpP protease subunit
MVAYLKVLSKKRALLAGCSAYPSTLKTVTIASSEMSIKFYQITQRHIPDDSTVHSENLESNILRAVYDITGTGATLLHTHKSESCGSQHINDEIMLVINTEGGEFVPGVKIYIDHVKIS